MWCSNSIGPGEYRNMLGFSDTDMEVKRLLRHTGKIDFNEIRQKIAYMEDCDILMNYFMRSMVLSIVRPILTIYIELLKQVKELCNGRYSAKELADLTLGQVLHDEENQSDHKALCSSIENLFAQFGKLWSQKIEPLVEDTETRVQKVLVALNAAKSKEAVDKILKNAAKLIEICSEDQKSMIDARAKELGESYEAKS